MLKTKSNILFFLFLFLYTIPCFSETIYLKDGRTIETNYSWSENMYKIGYFNKTGKMAYIEKSKIDFDKTKRMEKIKYQDVEKPYHQQKIDTQTAIGTIQAWMTYIKQKNWIAMVPITQKTWAAHKSTKQTAKQLSGEYDFFNISNWEILTIDKKTDMFYTITVSIDTNFGKKIMTANVIKETEPYHPDINGDWGINPTSAMFH